MKKKLGLLLYVMSMLLMAVVFVYLDQIVGCLFKTETNDLRVVDFEQYEAMGKDPVYHDVRSIQFEPDDWQTFTISGRCTVDTETENSDKTVTLLFRSEDICYASERRAIAGGPMEGAERPFGYNHRFDRSIALLPLKDGVYDMYLFDRENDRNQGLVDMRIAIVKDRDGIRLKERTVELDLDEDRLYTNARICLDLVEEAGERTLAIQGWGFLEDTETRGQEVYLRLSTPLETKIVECERVSRTDVSKAFGNEKYDSSGYMGYADRGWIGDGPLDITVIIKDGTDVYTGADRYQWDPQEGRFAVVETTQVRWPPDPLSGEVPFPTDDVRYVTWSCLDRVEEQMGQIWIEGWTAVEGQDTSGQTVFLEIQKVGSAEYAECTPVLRTGVGDVLGDRAYDHSGYICRLDMDDLPKGGFDFKLFVQNAAGVFTDGAMHHYDAVTGEFR